MASNAEKSWAKPAVRVTTVLLGVPAFGFAAAPTDWSHGIDLVWFSPTVDQRTLNMTLDNLAAIGVDHVATNVWWFQNNINSTQIAPNFNLYSATDQTVQNVIEAAHARNMSVELRPVVDLSNDSAHWRGDITGGTTWFNSTGGYGDFIRHFADIAQQEHVELFSVGAELETVQTQEASWRSLVASVRTHYSGPLVYAANWGNPAIGNPINWWDAVDDMAIDAYYPLTNKTNPTEAELQAAWATRAGQIAGYRNSVAPGKPLLFAEAGYVNQDGTNEIPYGTAPGSANDQQEQADSYQALLTENLQQSYFNGVYWWSADLNANPSSIGYETMGKLAFDTMGSFYKAGYTIGPSWKGTSGNSWATGGNWSNGTAVGTFTTATFNGPGNGNTNISLGGPVAMMRLIFDGSTTAAYSFAAGNTLTFNTAGGITVTPTVTTNQTLNCNVALQGPAIFANGGTGKVIVNGGITGGSVGLERLCLLNDGGGGTLGGAISDGAGTIAIYKDGNSTWTLAGSSSYSGATDVMGGTLSVINNNALGSSTGSTTIANGGCIVLNPGVNIANETLLIAGTGVGGQGAFQVADQAPYVGATWGGTIVLDSSASVAEIQNPAFNGGSSIFVLGGKITGGTAGGTFRLRSGNSNPAYFRLTGVGSDYLGVTEIAGGKVILAAGTNTLPTSTVVRLDSYGRPNTVEAGVLDLNGTNQTIAGLTNITEATPSRVVNRLSSTTSTLHINSTSSYSFDGSLQNGGGTLALEKLGGGVQTLSGSSSFTGGVTVSAGTLIFAATNSAGAGSLNVTGGNAVFTAGISVAPKFTGVSISSGRIDLNNNKLVLDNPPAVISIDNIKSAIGSAFAGGAWTGSGITSSFAAATARSAHTTAIGYATQAALGIGSFGGQTTLNPGDVLLRYTFDGDANLDGKVTTADFSLLAGGFGQPGQYWSNGDFNYDGVVNALDFNAIASNYGQQLASAPLLGALVPEPASAMLLVTIGMGIASRRKRRCHLAAV